MRKDNNSDYFTIEPCASSKSYEIKLKKQIDIENADFGILGEVIAKTTAVALLKLKSGAAASIYASGRIMVKESNREEVESLAKKFVKIYKLRMK